MISDNTDSKIWRYLKKGDIVLDGNDSVWGNTIFEIYGFHGNSYCPLLSVYFFDKFYKSGERQRCNLEVRNVRLINSLHRPFKNMEKNLIIKLMTKRNIEAKREFIMRANSKKN